MFDARTPFMGLVGSMFEEPDAATEAIGPVLFRTQMRYAADGDDRPRGHDKLPLRWWVRHLPKMLRSKITGRDARGPLFDDDGRPIAVVAQLDEETTRL
jgi:hypothetical protein